MVHCRLWQAWFCWKDGQTVRAYRSVELYLPSWSNVRVNCSSNSACLPDPDPWSNDKVVNRQLVVLVRRSDTSKKEGSLPCCLQDERPHKLPAHLSGRVLIDLSVIRRRGTAAPAQTSRLPTTVYVCEFHSSSNNWGTQFRQCIKVSTLRPARCGQCIEGYPAVGPSTCYPSDDDGQ